MTKGNVVPTGWLVDHPKIGGLGLKVNIRPYSFSEGGAEVRGTEVRFLKPGGKLSFSPRVATVAIDWVDHLSNSETTEALKLTVFGKRRRFSRERVFEEIMNSREEVVETLANLASTEG